MFFRRRSISLWLLGAVFFLPERVSGEAPSIPFPDPPALQLNLQQFNYIAADISATLLYSKTSTDDGPRKAGIVAGGVMIFGGGLLYLAGHLLAFRAYDDYRKSAFTGQTDRLRRKTLIFNGMRIGGGVIGGIGVIVLVVSF